MAAAVADIVPVGGVLVTLTVQLANDFAGWVNVVAMYALNV
jgi:hypothetical protein